MGCAFPADKSPDGGNAHPTPTTHPCRQYPFPSASLLRACLYPLGSASASTTEKHATSAHSRLAGSTSGNEAAELLSGMPETGHASHPAPGSTLGLCPCSQEGLIIFSMIPRRFPSILPAFSHLLGLASEPLFSTVHFSFKSLGQ